MTDHQETSAVEAIGRLSEIAAAVEFASGDGISFRESGAAQLAADIRLVLSELRHSVEREAGLAANLNSRDDFIVARGLWNDFTDQLPPTPPSTGADS